jgi:hypothetical protein
MHLPDGQEMAASCRKQILIGRYLNHCVCVGRNRFGGARSFALEVQRTVLMAEGADVDQVPVIIRTGDAGGAQVAIPAIDNVECSLAEVTPEALQQVGDRTILLAHYAIMPDEKVWSEQERHFRAVSDMPSH